VFLEYGENLSVVGGSHALDVIAGIVGQELGKLCTDPLGIDQVGLDNQMRIFHKHEGEEMDRVDPQLGIPYPEVTHERVDVDDEVLV